METQFISASNLHTSLNRLDLHRTESQFTAFHFSAVYSSLFQHLTERLKEDARRKAAHKGCRLMQDAKIITYAICGTPLQRAAKVLIIPKIQLTALISTIGPQSHGLL